MGMSNVVYTVTVTGVPPGRGPWVPRSAFWVGPAFDLVVFANLFSGLLVPSLLRARVLGRPVQPSEIWVSPVNGQTKSNVLNMDIRCGNVQCVKYGHSL